MTAIAYRAPCAISNSHPRPFNRPFNPPPLAHSVRSLGGRNVLSETMHILQPLLVGNDNLSIVDSLDDVVRGLAVDGAADRLCGTEDLLDAASERLGERLVGEFAGNVVDLVEGDVARVLDVLLLLAVPRGLLQGLDDEGGGGWDDRDGGLTVLDGELDGDTETLPVTGSLGNVFSDLLGGLCVGKVV